MMHRQIKEADIGISMGVNGTDVTREASDMVLMDDNFATIAEAVKRGSGIYDNIRKFIRYMLACNFGEVVTMFAGVLFGLPLPLYPIQILWVNLVTDGLPGIALGVDPVTDDIMNRKPVPADRGPFLWQNAVLDFIPGVANRTLYSRCFCKYSIYYAKYGAGRVRQLL